MTFATEITKTNSERYFLVRFTPRKYISTLLSADGGGLYSMTFNNPIESITRDTTTLTADSSAPTVNDHYYLDESTNTLTVKLAAVPTSGTIIVKYYLFYTTSRSKYLNSDPTLTNGTNYLWEERIKDSLSVETKVDPYLSSKLSVSATAVNVIDEDNVFKAYLTHYDSWIRADASYWLGVNDQLQKVFQGKVNRISKNPNVISISVYDGLAALNKPAYFNDTRDEVYFLRQSGSFPNMMIAQEGIPCPVAVGRYTPVDLDWVYNTTHSLLTPMVSQQGWRAVNVNFSSTISQTVNRVYGLCRAVGLKKTFSNGTISSLTCSTEYVTFDISTTNFAPGDTFSLNQAGNTDYFMVFSVVDNGGYFTVNALTTGHTSSYTYTLGATIDDESSIHVRVFQDSSWFVLAETRDFTSTETVTTGGNWYNEITLLNNMETNHPSTAFTFNTIDPNTDFLYFSIGFDDSGTAHRNYEKVFEYIVEYAGLTIDTASFAQAGTDVGKEVVFSVPEWGQSDYSSYLYYLQELAKSMQCIFFQNSSFEIELHQLDDPTTGTAIGEGDVAEFSVRTTFEYDDVITDLNSTNDHDRWYITSGSTTNKWKYYTTVEPRYLQQIDETKIFKTYVYKGETAQSVLDLASYPATIYSLKLFHPSMNLNINDDITLTHRQIISDSSSIDLTIISVKYSEDYVEIEATDFYGR